MSSANDNTTRGREPNTPAKERCGEEVDRPVIRRSLVERARRVLTLLNRYHRKEAASGPDSGEASEALWRVAEVLSDGITNSWRHTFGCLEWDEFVEDDPPVAAATKKLVTVFTRLEHDTNEVIPEAFRGPDRAKIVKWYRHRFGSPELLADLERAVTDLEGAMGEGKLASGHDGYWIVVRITHFNKICNVSTNNTGHIKTLERHGVIKVGEQLGVFRRVHFADPARHEKFKADLGKLLAV